MAPSNTIVQAEEVPILSDSRGHLGRLALADNLPFTPRQILHSHTAKRHTLRGMHWQQPPYCEAKVIATIRGQIYWVVVDFRDSSVKLPSWQGFTLQAGQRLSVPAGFAHGCLSLSDDVDLIILSDQDHHPEASSGFRYDDPDLAISWPLAGASPFMSASHRGLPSLSAIWPYPPTP